MERSSEPAKYTSGMIKREVAGMNRLLGAGIAFVLICGVSMAESLGPVFGGKDGICLGMNIYEASAKLRDLFKGQPVASRLEVKPCEDGWPFNNSIMDENSRESSGLVVDAGPDNVVAFIRVAGQLLPTLTGFDGSPQHVGTLLEIMNTLHFPFASNGQSQSDLKWICNPSNFTMLIIAKPSVSVKLIATTNDSMRTLLRAEFQNEAASSRSQPVTHPPRALESIVASKFETEMNKDRQAVFDGIHPVGIAKWVNVHAAKVTQWKGDRPTNREEDIVQCVFRYTIYWEGPIEKKGFTKVESLYDRESQMFIGGRVLETNGITKDQVAFNVGAFIGELLNKN